VKKKSGSYKTVAITGGAGFIGSHVVDALLDAGHRVRVLDTRLLERGEADWVEVDVMDQTGSPRPSGAPTPSSTSPPWPT
jgi:nucleoside-diphosphate-sugar epimerase